jgi:hypothetical protein
VHDSITGDAAVLIVDGLQPFHDVDGQSLGCGDSGDLCAVSQLAE